MPIAAGLSLIAIVQRGIFITFEGSEACGKTTQIERLIARLQDLKRPVLQIREPGSTAVGEEIRHLLQFSAIGHSLVPEAELLLFAASRAQLVREKIIPALEAGDVVIADRFMDSTTVYQGVARRIDPALLAAINRFAVSDCVPDVTFLLDLDPAVARQRLLRRPRPVGAADRMESQPPEFYENVRAGYLRLAYDEPRRIFLIDATQSISEIETLIHEHLQKKFHGIF